MTMKLLTFRRAADNTVRIRVHLDDTKTVDVLDTEGNATGTAPDPAWVMEHDWPPRTALPDPPTAADYATMVRREAKLLAQEELAARQTVGNLGTALGGEGEAL